jgi:hypothetical protein
MRPRPAVPVVLAALGLLTGRAAAQAGADTMAVVRGVVHDSLITAGPLRGAEVWIEGTNRTARTDAAGRFEFGALRPGRYTLVFYHPVLDSTRLSAPPLEVVAEGGRTVQVILATPSPASVHAALCPHDPRQDTGVVLGWVRDGQKERPLGDVPVTAEWTAFTIIGAGANRWEPRVVTARSDSSGRVVLCSIPTDVVVLIRGQVADGPSGMLALDLAGHPFGRADLELVTGNATGTVIGVVRNRNGSLVAGAAVSAVGAEARVEADPQGRFTLQDVAAGSRIVEAHAIGYQPARVQTTIEPGQVRRVEITLGDTVQVLEPIQVTATSYLATIGFEKRRKSLEGHFLDESDIAKTGATRVEEIFRLVPGIVLRPSGMGYVVEFQRGQGQILNPSLANYCPPSYYIDGNYFPLPPNQTLTLPLVPQEILAIEVYSNLFSAPLQYQRRDSGCGVILIWTKRGAPKRNR